MRALLWLALLLVLGVSLCSAALRLANSPIGCTPAPACALETAAAQPTTPADAQPPAWQQTLRLTHRISASLAGVVFLFIVVFGFARWSASQRVAGLALLVLTLALALVGRITPAPSAAAVLGGVPPPSAPVVLTNLLGGHLLLAALAWLLVTPPSGPRAAWPGAGLSAAVLAVSASGVMVTIGTAAGWASAHAALGAAALLALAVLAWRWRGRATALAAATALVAAATAFSGLPTLQQALHWPAAVVHSVLAGLTLAAAAALWRGSRG
ncbi:MAG: hypothetical protein HS128_20315 [Ideonella sp.]|nr:hypothetical protein [Ideonella sp.]MCC7458819.1 hypothetical protein [Nitrospira sp.]